MENLIILGAGGHGKVVADIAIKLGRYSKICFLDDADMKENMGIPVIGKLDDYEVWLDNSEFFVAIGNSRIRNKYLDCLVEKEASIATLIHPSACLGHSVKVGYGTVIMAGVVINPDTCIGKGVIVNTASSIDHDNIIGNFSHISVGAHVAGTVHVKEHVWIGAGATISNNVTICEACTIGAGAVVIKDIEEQGVYVGVPAKKVCN